MEDTKGATRYIGRYLGKPAIAEYRIVNYDGDEVTFWYEDHKTKKRVVETITVETFMGRLLMHIPQPTHSSSDMIGLPSSPMTIVSSPARTLGQYFIHSWAHCFDLHRSRDSTAIRIIQKA